MSLAGVAGKGKRTMAMLILKKCLSRRTVLRGVGASVGLPLLQAMIPAGVALSKTAAAP